MSGHTPEDPLLGASRRDTDKARRTGRASGSMHPKKVRARKGSKKARRRAALRLQRVRRIGIASVLLGVGTIIGVIAGSVALRPDRR